MTNINELTAKLKAAEEVVELQRFKLERQAEDLHQAKSLESIHREKRYDAEREFDSYKHDAQKNSHRLAGEVCRLEDELEAAKSRIAELEARTITVKLPEGKDSPQGWKVDPEFISKVQDAIGYDEECQCWEGTPSMEMVEAVLIAAAGIKLQIEGE